MSEIFIKLQNVYDAIKSKNTQEIEGLLKETVELLNANNINFQTTESLSYMPNKRLTAFTALCALGKYINNDSKEIFEQYLLQVFEKMKDFAETNWQAKDSYGCTNLQWTIWSGRCKVVEKCLEIMKEKNLDVNILDLGGRNAVGVAIGQLHLKIVADKMVKILESGGVDIVLDSNSLLKALDIGNLNIIENNFIDSVNTLKLISALGNTSYLLKNSIFKQTDSGEKNKLKSQLKAFTPKAEELIDKILENDNFKWGSQDIQGLSAASWLIEFPQFGKYMEQIVKQQESKNHTTDVEYPCVTNITLLHWCADYNADKKVVALVKLGADVNAQTTSDSATPAHKLFLNPSGINSTKDKAPTLEILLNRELEPPYNPDNKMAGEKTVADLIKEIISNNPSEDMTKCKNLISDFTTWYDESLYMVRKQVLIISLIIIFYGFMR